MNEETSIKKDRRVYINDRDLRILRWIGEQYAATRDQVQKLLSQEPGRGATPGLELSLSTTRTWIRRMVIIGAVGQTKMYAQFAPFIWLTPTGLKIANLDFRPVQPAPTTFIHLYWCNQVRFDLYERRPDDVWRSERYLRRDIAREARKAPEMPDAHLITKNGSIIAIEVERADKEQKRLVARLRRRAIAYSSTWFFCSKEARPGVERARQRLEETYQGRIGIYDLPTL